MCLEKLQRIANKVRSLEKQAKTALYDQKDETGYRQLLYEKAELLTSLEDVVKKSDLPEEIADELLQFALNAEQAIKVKSVFFMGALLYPDDYKEGEPNNLELVIEEIRQLQ